MKKLLVEGWRFVPHSYALVNQQHCLAWLDRGDIELYHTDVPLLMPGWKRAPGLLDAASEARLQAIPPRPREPAWTPDAVLRCGFPHFFHGDLSGAPTFVWATSEFKTLEPPAIGAGVEARQALAGSATPIITPSNWAKQGFLNEGAAPERVHVVPHGVDPDVFKPADPAHRAELRRQLGWEGKLVLLNVSAMTPNKGIPMLVHAMAVASARTPNVLLVLKGSDELYQSQQRAAMEFSRVPPELAQRAAGRMTYLGQTLSTAQVVALYQAADAYVSPYRAEGFNLPVLEAAACGLPVVCTAGGSTDDFVDDSFCLRVRAEERANTVGRALFPDLDHLVQQVERVLADGAFRERAAKAGPAWARERFTWRMAADRIARIVLGI